MPAEATINRAPGPNDADSPAGASGRRLPRPRIEHAGLLAVLALSGALELHRLKQNGFANIYYSAAVKSMLVSLHNFFFVSADPNGLVSVDKPPLALWLEALSAKIFGFAPLSLLVPEAICGVLAVALIYFVVRPRFGVLGGLVSALALAVFPSFVAVSRDNGVDPLLILMMLAACGAGVRAIETGRTRMLLASALLVGLAFNTKSLAALLCVPGIALGYFICAPGSVRRRLGQLVLAGVLLVALSVSWSLAVDLTPAASRPYVGSSATNSEFQLEFGYNGLGRVGGQLGGPGGPVRVARTDVPVVRPPLSAADLAALSAAQPRRAPAKPKPRVSARVRSTKPIPFGGSPRIARIFGTGLGDQAGWTVPLALVGLIALLLVVRERRERRAGLSFVMGGWFLLELFTLDFSKGIVHPYYASALGPGLAVMIGAAAVVIASLVRSEDSRKAALGVGLAIVGTISTVAVELVLIHREGYPDGWRDPLIVLSILALLGVFAVGVRWHRAAAWGAGLLVLVLLVAPGIYSRSVWDAPVDGTFPTAGPYNAAGWGGIDQSPGAVKLNDALIAYLRGHDATPRFTVLTQSSDAASPLILLGINAASMGGYNTTDKALTGDGLARLVADREARYVLLGGPYWERGGNGASTAARLVCPLINQATWDPAAPYSRDFYLVDCAGRAAALRHPWAVAEAYVRTHPGSRHQL